MPDPNILFKNIPSATPQESFQNALVNYDNFKTMPIKHQLLEQRAAAGETSNQQEKLKFQLFDMANDAMQLKPVLESGNIPAAMQALDRRVAKIRERGGDPSDTLELMQQLQDGDLKGALSQLDAPINAAQQLGIITDIIPAGMREFSQKTQGLTDEQKQQARLIDLGLAPRMMGSSQITIAQQGLTQPVARSQADIAGAKAGAEEGAKLDQQAGKAPGIAGDVAAAESDAANTSNLKFKPKIEAAAEKAKFDAQRENSIAKAISDEKEVGRILDLAEPLLSEATESLSGAVVDAAGRLVGASPKGARVAARLKTLEGALVMKMPRMEGPQSNFDQQLYRQMAAQIGDPSIPAEERQAAVDTLRMLNSRYTGQTGGAKQGGKLMIDANGNKAMVYPDGSFEEVK